MLLLRRYAHFRFICVTPRLCRHTVLCYGTDKGGRKCPCGVLLQQWQDEHRRKPHVHLVTIIGLRMVEAKGDSVPTRTVEAAVPCVLQNQNNPIQLGSHCELVTHPSVQFAAPCGFLNYTFSVSNAQCASVAHLRARQLHCPLQQSVDLLCRPPLGKLMRLLREATGVVGSGQHQQVTWYALN